MKAKEDLQKKSNQDTIAERVAEVTQLRKRPLLIMFWPGELDVSDIDPLLLRYLFREESVTREEPLPELDVLIQTFGGNPRAAYIIAQTVRNYAKKVDFLVPEYSYSAGTTICLSGDQIHLGENATLSPIDITLARRPAVSDDTDTFDEEKPEDEIQTVGVDNFIQVAKQARLEIERGFRQRGWRSSRTEIESAMVCELVRQLTPMRIAHYYREKMVAHEYGRMLLQSYMFAGERDKSTRERKVDQVLRRLIVEAPSHRMVFDYHLCVDVGLKVEEMKPDLAAATLAASKALGAAESDASLFMFGQARVPLVQLHRYTQTPSTGESLQPMEEKSHATVNGKQK